MRRTLLSLCALLLGLGLLVQDADARRLGGARNSGMQREAIGQRYAAPQSPIGQPRQAASPNAPQPSTPTPAQPKRSWAGPLAGLAAGLGLGALLAGGGSGLSGLLGTLLTIVAVMVVFSLVLRLLRRTAPAPRPEEPLHYSGVGGPHLQPVPPVQPPFNGEMPPIQGNYGGSTPAPTTPVTAPALPEGFNGEEFLRIAKLNFIRLQAANDAGDENDLREFLAPEMFAEVKLQLAERGKTPQVTEVVQLEANLLEVVTENQRYIASVRFHGLVREEANGPANPFDEVWNLVKPTDGSRGWTVAGIQQLS